MPIGVGTMPRPREQRKTESLQARVEPDLYLQFRAAIAALGIDQSEIVREWLVEKLPELQRQARTNAQTQSKWPGSVKQKPATDRAKEELLRSFLTDGDFKLTAGECFGAKGWVLYSILRTIWDEDKAEHIEPRIALAHAFATEIAEADLTPQRKAKK